MKKVMVLMAALSLAACADSEHFTPGQMAGAIAGGAVGVFAGSQFGGGTGNLIFMIAGGLVGAGAGYSMGDELLPSDKSTFERSTVYAMNHAADGQQVNWANPETGVAGTIKPTRSYYAGQDRYCRDFTASIAVKSGVGSGDARACRIAGGNWFIDERA
ncbi:MAG: RT0821/Lpp0805 family surface protein [Rhodospirillaceae bacterium]